MEILFLYFTIRLKYVSTYDTFRTTNHQLLNHFWTSVTRIRHVSEKGSKPETRGHVHMAVDGRGGGAMRYVPPLLPVSEDTASTHRITLRVSKHFTGTLGIVINLKQKTHITTVKVYYKFNIKSAVSKYYFFLGGAHQHYTRNVSENCIYGDQDVLQSYRPAIIYSDLEIMNTVTAIL